MYGPNGEWGKSHLDCRCHYDVILGLLSALVAPRSHVFLEVLSPISTTATNGQRRQREQDWVWFGQGNTRVFNELYLLFFTRWTHCPDHGWETL